MPADPPTRPQPPALVGDGRPAVVLYTSSHGFGHAVRCSILCRALLAAAPNLRIVARTAAPAWIFPPGVAVEPATIDTGVVQPDSLSIDPAATLARYAAHVAQEGPLLAAEAAYLRRIGAGVVVADVPSAAFEIAARAGVPGIGLANFSWDWIYEPYVAAAAAAAPEHAAREARLLDHLRAQYGRATTLLRLPFHDGLTAFPVVEEIPLIARRSRADRAATRRRFGLPAGAPLVLFSFGGHASGSLDEDRLAALPDCAFVATATGRDAPLAADGVADRRGRNLFLLPQLTDGYVDLLAACDAVVTKPGYGIVADLIANRVPALYVSRDGFREEAVLIRALETEARAVPLDRAALDALDLGPALARLWALAGPWTERPLNGAAVAAERILALAGLG